MLNQPPSDRRTPYRAPSFDRRLERACEHVSKMWFPADPQLLDRVRHGLLSGAYDLRLDQLIEEIRNDFALFTFCLKGLAKQLAAERLAPPRDANPVEILRWAGLSRLRRVLHGEDNAISFHDLRELSDFQAARLKEALVSASTTEVLAEHSSVDPAAGYSTALLRQLGLTLIAWNYPALYHRSLAAQGKETLDDVLTRALGFTPARLGAAIMHDWPLTPTVQAALTEPNRPRRDLPPNRLEHLCRIGEMLARANHPEHYPQAESDWLAARREIQTTLGMNGLDAIRTRTQSHTRHYADLEIIELNDIAALDPARRVQTHSATELLKANSYLRGCPPLLARKIRDLYANIVPGRIDRTNINTLVRQIIPSAGFSGGAIYILDPLEPRLIHRLAIGTPRRDYLPIVPLNEADHPIVLAFQCLAPIHEAARDGYEVLAGGIGGTHRAGVLYLEYSEIIPDTARLLNSFRAIRQALTDCLGFQ